MGYAALGERVARGGQGGELRVGGAQRDAERVQLELQRSKGGWGQKAALCVFSAVQTLEACALNKSAARAGQGCRQARHLRSAAQHSATLRSTSVQPLPLPKLPAIQLRTGKGRRDGCCFQSQLMPPCLRLDPLPPQRGAAVHLERPARPVQHQAAAPCTLNLHSMEGNVNL